MEAFSLSEEQRFDPERHVEHILSKWGGGDISLACWEPGQISPYHCHPHACEIYFCFSGGGKMRTPQQTVDVPAGSFVIHPPGEPHEYINGAERTLLLRFRTGEDMSSRHIEWPTNPSWQQRPEDAAYYAKHPPGNE